RWARSLPVYITETDQNGPWSNADGGWVKAAYREISDWNGGAGSDERQKIQALALYRWHGDQDAIDDKPLVQQDLLEAMDVDAPSPAPAMPADPRVNACSTEDVGQAPWTPPQTNFTLSGYILDFWTHNGGLPVFGYPIERAHRMVNSSNAYVCSQMFERHRIELVLNPDGSVVMHGARPFVTLGLVGNEVYPRDADMVAEHPLGYGASGNGAGDCETFSQVGFSICGEFKAYWHAHGLVDGGSLQLFGYPKSQPFAYASGNGHTYVAQYFERARLELHPEDPNQRIKGGLLGDELNEGRRF
ncbi:MAG TPA: hypothetical protein VHB21_05275, partial [Minicystis sp.]|nr:hypothetical protein [Minicystis sp.]